MTRALVACLVVAACGDNQQPVEIAVPYGTPAFVAYKANGTWHGAKPTERGYRIDTVGPYQFVFVCADAQGFDVEELFADTSDGDQAVFTTAVVDACFAPRQPTGSARIEGSVQQAGTLMLGLYGTEAFTQNWTYDFGLAQGRYDLVFRPEVAATPVIRRDVDVGIGMNPQAPIDAAVEGVALAKVPLTITGAMAGSHYGVSTTLVTANGAALIVDRSDAPMLLPDAMLRTGEHQLIDLDIAEQATSSYFDHVTMSEASELVAHVQPPPDVTYAASELGTSVTWQHEPLDAVGYELTVTANGDASVIHGFTTKDVAYETLDLAVDRDAPGFLDAWRPIWSTDLDSSTRSFQVAALRDGNCYETQLLDRGRETAVLQLGSRCSQLLP
jgi:hypothetical protein